jgi:hypothetical protein
MMSLMMSTGPTECLQFEVASLYRRTVLLRQNTSTYLKSACLGTGMLQKKELLFPSKDTQ